ncbi:MAG TPA: DUF2721 domain-containing protein [Chthoniobacteraceae bacterium]|nr:DUF2721 domain-containing protein [Chthoniobacteraceae bacterium]
MNAMNAESFTKLLQFSVSPVVLVSGVGLLLLSVTNRLGRAIDRSRILARELDDGNAADERRAREQLRIMVRRAGFLRVSVSAMVASIFFSCLMVLCLFVLEFFEVPCQYGILAAFGLGLLSLLCSMLYLLMDIYLSLKALKIEVARHLE